MIGVVSALASTAAAGPTAGRVPGTADLTITVAADSSRCDGVRYRVTRVRGARSEARFLSAMTVAFPTGLALGSKDPARNQAAMKRFNAWLQDATKRMADARAYYEKIVTASPSLPAVERVTAAARIAQIERHFADVISTAEIPRALLTSDVAKDAIGAYCDTLDETAAPLTVQAVQAAAACAKLAADAHVAPGWWDAVCVEPPKP